MSKGAQGIRYRFGKKRMFVKKLIIIVLTGFYVFYMQAISIVYNMRIASITRRQHANEPVDHEHAILGTPVGQWRQLNTGTKQHDAGMLYSYIYTKQSYYIKVDSAVGHAAGNIPLSSSNGSVHVAVTQWDDLLFTGGYGYEIGSKGRIAYSALFGIPLHRDHLVEFAQFGTGHVGIGGQIDTAHEFSDAHTVFFALRGIYFIPRCAYTNNPCLEPFLPQSTFKVKLGTLFDIFISHQVRWATHNRFEYGYDATFAPTSSINPPLFDHISFIRHSFFAVYFRTVPFFGKPTGLVIGFSGGFDSKPELLSNRYHTTLWGSWGLAF